MSAMIRSKQLSRSSVLTLIIRGLVIIRQDSTPPIQSLLPPFTLLSNVRLGHTDYDGVLVVPRLLFGRSHRC